MNKAKRPGRVWPASTKPVKTMGFDQNDPRPIINVHKPATKVNLWMVVGVLVFLLAGGLLIWLYVQRHGST